MRKDCVARELTIEIVVGTFMIMVLLGLGYFTIILSSTTIFSKTYPIEVVFNHVRGLRDGDTIMVRGMPVGEVKSLKLQADGVHVIGALDHPVEMREGYAVEIVASSMLGGQHLEIRQGDEDGDVLPGDMVYRGETPYDLMADAAELVHGVKQGILENGILDSLQRASADLETVVGRISAGKGTIGRLLSEDDELYEDIAATMASLRDITGKLERGEGTLGHLITDDDLYQEIHGISEEARAAIDDFRETAPVTTFTSIFFGAL